MINSTMVLFSTVLFKILWHKEDVQAVEVQEVQAGISHANAVVKKVNINEEASRWHMQVQIQAEVNFLSAL